MEAKSYFFISHSSKDLEKVRKIRNLIESLDGNPIMFYLKCLDNDDPSGQDEIELKSLIYREIAAREKIIICKSQNTEPPLETKWIEWEKNVIWELSDKLKPFIIDIDNSDYLECTRKVVMKFKSILVASTYETPNANELVNYLKTSLNPYHIDITTLFECQDMMNDMAYNHGAYTKDIIKDQIQRCNLEDKALVLLLLPENGSTGTFAQMVYAYSSRYNCYFMPISIPAILSDESMSSILKNICDFLFS